MRSSLSMLFLQFCEVFLLCVTVDALDAYPVNIALKLDHAAPIGFNLNHDDVSRGGESHCINSTGLITVTVTMQNFKIKYNSAERSISCYRVHPRVLKPSSTLVERLVGGPRQITGTYSIYSSLCLPANPAKARHVKTVHFLTHGDTTSSSDWDIAPGYSYIDVATAARYATFSYDLIGVGKSDHPDPIQVVQGPLQVEFAHAPIEILVTSTFIGHMSRTGFLDLS